MHHIYEAWKIISSINMRDETIFSFLVTVIADLAIGIKAGEK